MIKKYFNKINRMTPYIALVAGLGAIDGLAYLAYNSNAKPVTNPDNRPSIKQVVPVIEKREEPLEKQEKNDEKEDTPSNDYKEERDISDEGLMLVKQFEGFRPRLYKDGAGKKTIGYGHRVKKGEKFKFLTRKKGEKLLREDISKADRCVDNYVEVPLTQSQHDALVSFVYNVGGNGFRESTLLEKLNDGNYNGARDEFGRWIYAYDPKEKIRKPDAGLINRREEESRLFAEG